MATHFIFHFFNCKKIKMPFPRGAVLTERGKRSFWILYSHTWPTVSPLQATWTQHLKFLPYKLDTVRAQCAASLPTAFFQTSQNFKPGSLGSILPPSPHIQTICLAVNEWEKPYDFMTLLFPPLLPTARLWWNPQPSWETLLGWPMWPEPSKASRHQRMRPGASGPTERCQEPGKQVARCRSFRVKPADDHGLMTNPEPGPS